MNLKVKSLLFIWLISSIGCNFKKRHFTELLKSIDTVRIQRFINNDTLSISVTDKRDIDIFKNIINGTQENIPANLKTGRILFYSNGKLILNASQFNEVIEYSSNNINYRERISYQAGMYFDFAIEKKSHHNKDSSGYITTKKKEDSPFKIKIKKGKFNKDEPFQIINSARAITNQSSATDTNLCKGWTISNINLAKIIKDARSIGGTEWDLSFLVLPCIFKGQLIQNGNPFDFEVNGGSWFYIKSSDTTMIFGNFKKEDAKYFIEEPYKK
jgi:hypothetical protein